MKKRYISIILAGLLAVSPVCQSAYAAQLGTEDGQVVIVEETEAAETEGSRDVATGETENTEILIEESVAEEEASEDEVQLVASEEAGIFETVVKQEEVSESEVESVEAEDTKTVFNEAKTELQIDEASSVEQDEIEETSEATSDEVGVLKTARLAASKSDSTSESPIESIEFREIKLIENVDGYIDTDYNYETSERSPEYFKYIQYGDRPRFTARMKDGTELESYYNGSIYYNNKWYDSEWIDDQSYENQWGIGEHTVHMSIMGFETTVVVEVVENPVESVEFENVKVIENADIITVYYIKNSEYLQYVRYSYDSPHCTVKLKDGTKIESNDRGAIYYNNKYYYSEWYDDQSYENQWGLGEHVVYVSIMGVEDTFTVEIIESPVERIEVTSFRCIKDIDGYMRNYDAVDVENTEYFYYRYIPEFKVILNDGTILESQAALGESGLKSKSWEIVKYNGHTYFPSYFDDQGFQNQWGLGEHVATISVIGSKPVPFTVEVIETPVKSVEIDGLENINFEDTNTCYDKLKVTLILDDETVLECENWNGNEYYVVYRGIMYLFKFYDKVSETDPWGIKHYTISANILGFDVSFVQDIADSSAILLEANNGQISAMTTDGSFDKDMTLFADEVFVNEEVIKDIFMDEGESESQNVVSYDVYLKKGGQKVQANGEVTVSVQVPNTLNGEKCSVFYIDNSGKATNMNAVWENGYMVFITDHFGYYALIGETSGVTVGGTVTSYGTNSTPVTVTLLDGTTEIDKVITTDGIYTFASVPSGTYTLQVSKENHVTRSYDITVSDETVTQDVKICLVGDITGDGKVNTRDLNRLYAHVNGTNPLTGYEFDGGDVTEDGKINTRDLNRLYAHISETNMLW